MNISENPAVASDVLQSAIVAQDARSARLPGLHVSDLVFCRVKAWLSRQPGHIQTPITDTQAAIFLAGWGHHAILEDGFEEVKVQIATPSGIVHGTIDRLCIEEDAAGLTTWIPTEIKTTRASANKTPDQSSHYIEQVASYALGLRVHRARLLILHLLGDYKLAKSPVLKCWDLDFTPGELAAWHGELMNRAEQATSFHIKPDPTDPSTHYGWECGYCPFLNNGCSGGPGLKSGFFQLSSIPSWIEDLSVPGVSVP